MKTILMFMIVTIFFFGCSKEPKILKKSMPNTYLLESSFTTLPNWDSENYREALNSFIHSCKTKRTKKIYSELCQKAEATLNAKSFLELNFTPYIISSKESKSDGLLTGYYEPELKGSMTKTPHYKYPLFATPSDLITVDLSSIYPELRNYRLRGKIEGNRVVPYDARGESGSNSSSAICYVDSKIDLFFLEIQGSGRVILESGETLFVGYANQNGQKYRAIGRYLVKIGALELKDVSLQSIRAWLDAHPKRVDEVLNYNKSLVYFQVRKRAASGALGLELTPNRSIAVDRKYIPLGSMLYLNSKIANKNISRLVMAEDTGGAIKGAVRADMFLGFTREARNIAGELKSPLKLWIMLPKIKEKI